MVTIPGYVNQVGEKTPVPEQRSANETPLSPVAALLRRSDRDRYQTALFAPAARREALFALYAFNYEIARVRESVSQPILGRIRLEWWHENVAAAFAGATPRHHPVAQALAAVIRDCAPTRGHFERLIDARAADFDDEPAADLAALEAYAEGTSSPLVYLALDVLGVHDAAATTAGRHVGIAYALAGLLRALPFRLGDGRATIPLEIARRYALDFGSVDGVRKSPGLRGAVAEIAAAAERHLRIARAGARSIPTAALPALLPAVIGGHALRRLRHADYDPFDAALLRRDPLQSWRLAAAALRRRY